MFMHQNKKCLCRYTMLWTLKKIYRTTSNAGSGINSSMPCRGKMQSASCRILCWFIFRGDWSWFMELYRVGIKLSVSQQPDVLHRDIIHLMSLNGVVSDCIRWCSMRVMLLPNLTLSWLWAASVYPS